MTLLVETITPPEHGRLDVDLRLSADIQIGSDMARRLVSLFVSQYIADLLHGDTPNLVWREQGAFWRVPVILSAPSKGRIGVTGTIDVDVQTGELFVTDELLASIEAESNRLANNAAL
jgi:hypothetical protein